MISLEGSWTILAIGRVEPSGLVVPGDPEEDARLAKSERLMSRGSLLAAKAVRRALVAGGIGDPQALGMFLGVGASGGPMDEVERLLTRGLGACHPLLAFRLMNNFTLCHSAILEGIRGPNAAFFSRGSGTAFALMEACRAIRDGECRQALAGGADSALHPVTRAERSRAGNLTPPGEGAAVLLLGEGGEPGSSFWDGPRVREIAVYAPGEALPEPTGTRTKAGDAANRWGPGPDLTEAFGDAEAATPALGWAKAADLLRAGASGVEVVGSDPDGTAWRVVFEAREQKRPMLRPVSSPRRAVITGAGAVTGFGAGLGALLDGLAAGGAGAGGQIEGVDPQAPRWGVDASALRDRKIAWALLAASEAWAQAGCGPGETSAAMSIALGLEVAFLEDFAPLLAEGRVDWSREAPARPGETRYRSAVDLASGAIREALGISGPAAIHASACAAGALAVGHAAALIADGAGIVLCGGADSMVNPLGLAGMGKLGVPSAKGVCRPFDRRRDGTIIGEGAAMFVVEDLERALARGARPLAEILGWGSAQDGYQPTAPRPDGSSAKAAMEAALRRANLPASAVGYVNAHGTGTPQNDIAEAKAIRELFGPDVPVSSVKGALGHLMAAAGSVEIAACLLAFQRDILPGTAGLQDLDPRCGIRVLGETPIRERVSTVLTASFGFGGQDAAVLLSRYV